jgi:hypothetical protein
VRRAAALALALLAGCLGPSEPSPQDRGSGPVVPPLTDSSALTLPLIENAFAWSSDALRDAAGLRLRIEATETTHCEFTGGAAQRMGRSGLTSVFAVLGPGVEGWSVTDSIASNHVHLTGLVDTRREAGPRDDLEARMTTFDVPGIQGAVDVLLLGRDLEPWASTLLHGASLLVSIDCDRPVRVAPAQATRAFTTVDARSMSGGAGAHLEPGASVSLLDAASSQAAGDHGYVFWGSVGGAGALTLDHPDGQERWPIAGPTTRAFEGRAGAYQATLARLGADFDYFFAVLAGLHDVRTLDELPTLPS